jgi:hypothetical protein
MAEPPHYYGPVAHFLLIYDRDAGRLVRKQEFESEADAMRHRFAAEAEFAGRPEIEIVALTAESEDTLLVTHGRYFLGLTELADRIA